MSDFEQSFLSWSKYQQPGFRCLHQVSEAHRRQQLIHHSAGFVHPHETHTPHHRDKQYRCCFKMLPLSLLKTAQNHPMLVELKNGETYNGHLSSCDNYMNIYLRDVICTSRDGDKFWRLPECYIRGSTIKYLRIPDEVVDLVKEEIETNKRGRNAGRGGPAGRGRGGPGRGASAGGRGGGGRGGGPGARQYQHTGSTYTNSQYKRKQED
jgi:U6 snRNA-associated Sm-like protein LSm4